MQQDYNKTLNLPATEFQMRASLSEKEPRMLEEWAADDMYEELLRRNGDKPLYVLHDGPPYANGDIHLGTAMNKVLKDIIIRYKNMSGFKSRYVPGWDTHGLPIELKAMKKAGKDIKSITPIELRKLCKEFAVSYVNTQREQFMRLGILGDFSDPYLTYKPEFEAKQIEVFGEMAKKGYIYKGLKPVYWCPDCNTALAEAEIEYAEDPCESIYVRFNVCEDNGLLSELGVPADKTYFVIWTTTTWTLPGNMAICLGPDLDYSVIKVNGEFYIAATALLDEFTQAVGFENYETVAEAKGARFERMKANHPFLDRKSLVILGDHVTLESGTGCVHTAPGHGVEDFDVCVNHYPEIEVIVPVDNEGKLTALAGQFEGLTTEQANKAIAEHIASTGHLLKSKKIIHQYPHCWRCKKPVLFRATKQWFCSIEDFREDALKAVDKVRWIPAWGHDRMASMISDRNDWCISRQRNWGVPIPVFYCEKCGKYHINERTIKAVAELFAKEGSDAWYKYSAAEILPADEKCDACGAKEFRKETDIMDVWFDSGTTHASVLGRKDLTWPCDLYLEGADQYRGWFQSSLLTAVAWRGEPPYKSVLTHGWTVDGEGRKMSKSLGNGILATDIVKDYGADILRLWVASSDYQSDVRVSKDILKQLTESYRKIRNTARFILGNLGDFNPDTDMVSSEDYSELDRYVLNKLNSLIERCLKAYEEFEFHSVYHSVHRFCVVDMSNFYLDILKDRLYVLAANDPSRRAAQSAIYLILDAITRLLTPILAFTSQEIWSFLPKKSGDARKYSVFAGMPEKVCVSFGENDVQKWDRITAIRNDVLKALEKARNDKIIGASLESEITLCCEGELYDFLSGVSAMLHDVFICSSVKLIKGGKGSFAGDVEGLSVTVSKASGERCERCWTYGESVGKSAEHPTLCGRCCGIVE